MCPCRRSIVYRCQYDEYVGLAKTSAHLEGLYRLTPCRCSYISRMKALDKLERKQREEAE